MAPDQRANQKAAKDFIPGGTNYIPGTTTYPTGGTTLNDISFQVVKRIGKDFEVNGNFAYERWKAPIYLSGQQTVTTTTIQLTWFPQGTCPLLTNQTCFRSKRVVLTGCTSGEAGFRMFVCLQRSLNWMG